MFIRPLLVGAGVATMMAGGFVPTAYADADFRSCSADGDTMNMSISYDLTSTQHIWHRFDADLEGNNNPDNDYQMSIWQNSQDRTWRHDSADNWSGTEHYSKLTKNNDVYVRTQRSSTELVYMSVNFDQAGYDPSCRVKLTY